MPKANSIDEMQEILKGWFRKPSETDDEYRERINSGDYEISIPLFDVPKLMKEQEERLRFDNAKPAIPDDCFNPTMLEPPPRNGVYYANDDCPDIGDSPDVPQEFFVALRWERYYQMMGLGECSRAQFIHKADPYLHRRLPDGIRCLCEES